MRKKALVTGGSGFVGRHMMMALDKRGWDIVNVDLVVARDAREFFNDFVNRVVRYDLIIHCAYNVGGRAGIDGQNHNFAQNLQLDSMMFEWAYRTQQSAVMYFSSCAAYGALYQDGNHSWPFREEWIDFTGDISEIIRPFDNYGWAKQTGERLAKHYSDMGLRVHVLRPFSGYGPDQGLDYPFPAIISRAMRDDLTVWGPPGQTRDWIHIDDVVNGALAVYDNDERRPVNLCTGVGTEMGELMKMVYGEVTGEGYCAHEPKITYLTNKPTGALYRVGDPTRMNEHYTAKISIGEGVKEAIGRL